MNSVCRLSELRQQLFANVVWRVDDLTFPHDDARKTVAP
jgi:hypothetical protein